MKYRDLYKEIQGYLNEHAVVKGTFREQKTAAAKACQEAIDNCSISARLKLQEPQSSVIIYNIIATVVAQDFRIGMITGTATAGPVELHLFGLEKYGNTEINEALLYLVKEFFEGNLEKVDGKVNKLKKEKKLLISRIICANDMLLREREEV